MSQEEETSQFASRGVTFFWPIVAVLTLAALSSDGCGKKGPTAPTGPEVKISIQALYMNVGATQTLTASGGDETKYVWSLISSVGGAIEPSTDTKSAILRAGTNPGSYTVTVASGSQSSFVLVTVLTYLAELKYIRPEGSVTNPFYTGKPGGFVIFFSYAGQMRNSVSCNIGGASGRATWDDDTWTLICEGGVSGVPKGDHLVYVSDGARAVFASSSPNSGIAGSEIVGNRIFVDREELAWGACPTNIISFNPARCAYFSK